MTNQLTSETGDTELVQRAKLGDLHALEALTNRHEQRIYSLGLSAILAPACQLID